jgi:hypothetical protein
VPSSPPYQGEVGGGLSFLAGALLAFLPQIIAWQVIFGRPFLIPQGGGFLLWLRPKIHLLLFSRHNGLITWTPIILFALIGLVLFARERKWRSLGIAFCVVIAAQVYLNSIVVDWYAGMGFGMRRFVGSMPVLMVGLGSCIHWLKGKIKGWQVSALVGLFILWNTLFLTQYYTGLVPWDRPVTWRELFLDKIGIVQALQRHTLQRAAVASIYGGNLQNGFEYAREAVGLGPHSPEARMALALAEARAGRRDAAAVELRAAAGILGGTKYVRTKFSSMLRRSGLGGEVEYYEEILKDMG